MTIDTPTWLQNGVYSARLDRIFADILFTEGVMRPGNGQFLVTASSPTAMTVEVAAGYACIEGDDQADQGQYLVRSTASETLAITAAPGSGTRIDLMVLRVNDSDAGGPAGDNATLEVIAGTPSGSPTPPALPDTAIPLAEVTVASGTTAITSGMISDVRGQAQTILANTLTTAGDLLSFDGSNTVRIPVGSAGVPLVSNGSAPVYGQVSAAGIASDAVTTAKILDLNVTTAKIADGAVTLAKLAGGVAPRIGCELTYSGSLTYPADIPSWTEVFDSSTFYTSGSTCAVPAGLGGLFLITLRIQANLSTADVGAARAIIEINGTQYSMGFVKNPSGASWLGIGASDSTTDLGTVHTSQFTLADGDTIGAHVVGPTGTKSTTARLIVTRLA